MTTVVRCERDMNADVCRFRGKGVNFLATAGTTTVNNYKFTENRIIDGVQVLVNNASFGDYITIKIIDIDGIFYPANTILDIFAETWAVASDTQNQGIFRLPYGAEIISGLYLSIEYISTGASNVSVAYNIFAHKYNA